MTSPDNKTGFNGPIDFKTEPKIFVDGQSKRHQPFFGAETEEASERYTSENSPLSEEDPLFSLSADIDRIVATIKEEIINNQ